MSTLSPAQFETLKSVVSTIHPSIEPESQNDDEALFRYSIDTDSIAQHIVRRLDSSTLSEAAQFKRLLNWLQTRWFCAFMSGRATPFRLMNQHHRVRLLQKMRDSSLPGLRRFFQSVKRLTLFVAYSVATEQKPNPAWKAMGYRSQNPIRSPAEDSTVIPQDIQNDHEIRCDVLVIGSGAGGAIAAAHAAKAGNEVVVTEKARCLGVQELGTSEMLGTRNVYEKHGALATRDLGFVVLAGSSVGGGTTVNWMTCLEPPENVRHEWANTFGLKQFLTPGFEDSIRSVKNRLNVNIESNRHNAQNQKLYDGCQRLGLAVQAIPRNTMNCQQCDFCNYGCRAGAKQDTRRTYLADAIKHGARLYDQVEVDKLIFRNGAVCGAIGTAGGRHGNRLLNVICKKVIVSAGSINSPAILMRSGIALKHIGKNLHLHPTTATVAFHDEKIEPWSGAPQTALCDHYANLDGNGYGVRLEAAPVHPGFAAMGLAWRDPAHHKHLMQQISHLSTIVVIARDSNGGKVILDRNGNAEIHYKLGKLERKFLVEGAIQSLRVHLASGAHLLFGPHQSPVAFSRHKSGKQKYFQDFDKFVDRIKALGSRSNSISLFSAHQMSTCRMASDSKHGVVNPDGRVFGIKNLYVCDGSVLPNACGVNPMITIMSVADMIAKTCSVEFECEQLSILQCELATFLRST